MNPVAHTIVTVLLVWLAAGCSQSVQTPVAPDPPAAPSFDQARDQARDGEHGPCHLDTSGADGWVACMNGGGSAQQCERESQSTLGGGLAGHAVESFGPYEGDRDPQPPPAPEHVESLTAAIKAWDLEGMRQEVMSFFPSTAEGTIKIYVVGNGHPWGDAYVRGVCPDQQNLCDQGEPGMFLNVVAVASNYPGTPRRQTEVLSGILKHELFHVLFDHYRRAEPSWRTFPEQPSPRQMLLDTVLNEGIAHFVDRRGELVATGFPDGRAERALTRLGEACVVLSEGALAPSEVEGLLRSANQGPYWEKFGSISGMYLAYVVYQHLGMEGMHQSVRCGPGRLLRLYVDAAGQADALPLPESVVDGARGLDLCGP